MVGTVIEIIREEALLLKIPHHDKPKKIFLSNIKPARLGVEAPRGYLFPYFQNLIIIYCIFNLLFLVTQLVMINHLLLELLERWLNIFMKFPGLMKLVNS